RMQIQGLARPAYRDSSARQGLPPGDQGAVCRMLPGIMSLRNVMVSRCAAGEYSGVSALIGAPRLSGAGIEPLWATVPQALAGRTGLDDENNGEGDGA